MADNDNFEREESGRGATPHFYPTILAGRSGATEHETTADLIESAVSIKAESFFPMVIYISDSGEVQARREGPKGGPQLKDLAANSLLVLRVTPQKEPGNSDGGARAKVEVLRCRMIDVKDLIESVVKAHLLTPGNERAMLEQIMRDEGDE